MRGVCGLECSICALYGRECDGCLPEMRSSQSYQCEVYRCATSRGLEDCTECEITKEDCHILHDNRALCPLIVQKTRFSLGPLAGPDSPIQ